MEILWGLIPGSLVFRIHLVAEGGGQRIEGHQEIFWIVTVKQAEKGAEKTEYGRAVLSLWIHHRIPDEGKVGFIDQAVAVKDKIGFHGTSIFNYILYYIFFHDI